MKKRKYYIILLLLFINLIYFFKPISIATLDNFPLSSEIKEIHIRKYVQESYQTIIIETNQNEIQEITALLANTTMRHALLNPIKTMHAPSHYRIEIKTNNANDFYILIDSNKVLSIRNGKVKGFKLLKNQLDIEKVLLE